MSRMEIPDRQRRLVFYFFTAIHHLVSFPFEVISDYTFRSAYMSLGTPVFHNIHVRSCPRSLIYRSLIHRRFLVWFRQILSIYSLFNSHALESYIQYIYLFTVAGHCFAFSLQRRQIKNNIKQTTLEIFSYLVFVIFFHRFHRWSIFVSEGDYF